MTSSSPSASTTNSSNSQGAFTDFEQNCLAAHNEYRARHQAPALKLNKELCHMAQEFANVLAKRKTMEHSTIDSRDFRGQNCGENLAFKASTEQPIMTAKDPPAMWYSEIKDYNFKKPDFKPGTGHFTQLVWRSTKEMGVAKALFRSADFNHVIVVARYWPTGNVLGEFRDNVLPPRLEDDCR